MSGTSSLLARMLDSGRYSDLTIKCGNKVFKVHRNVVCLQSRPLAAHVDGAFLEALTGEINLPDDHPAIFERIIKFLYTGDFDATPSTDETVKEASSEHVKEPLIEAFDENSPVLVKETVYEAVDEPLEILTICTRVFTMAEKYDIPELKVLAKTKFEEAVSTEWNTASLSASLWLMYDELPESDRLLKDIAIQAAASHVNELVDRGEFAALCKENGDIAFDVLKASLHVSTHSGKTCPYCDMEYENRVLKRKKEKYYCNNCNNYFR
ncbi:putative btb poz domain protein [Botrytis fragariae]|uniref:Putative btb poz domain protein n=1 Tax=Botrytis fragariae TaxID=1964551 RepID=A0A8H6AZ70_9HELO|nr:putative btb poz domain protein [Botrytis fragariae]KAF5876306.1 putative btb poz domain protein [Botrytis fragariae]